MLKIAGGIQQSCLFQLQTGKNPHRDDLMLSQQGSWDTVEDEAEKCPFAGAREGLAQPRAAGKADIQPWWIKTGSTFRCQTLPVHQQPEPSLNTPGCTCAATWAPHAACSNQLLPERNLHFQAQFSHANTLLLLFTHTQSTGREECTLQMLWFVPSQELHLFLALPAYAACEKWELWVQHTALCSSCEGLYLCPFSAPTMHLTKGNFAH